MVPSNIVLERDPVPSREGRFGRGNPQFVAMSPIAKLLWPLLLLIIGGTRLLWNTRSCLTCLHCIVEMC